MTIRAWITEHRDKYDDREKLIADCMKALKAGRKGVVKILSSMGHSQTPEAVKQTPKGVSLSTISIKDLVAQHDKVGEALRIITSIPDNEVMDDDSVRRELAVGNGKWRLIRGSTRMVGYFYELQNKKFVWGSKKTIEKVAEKMREVL